MTRRKYEGWKIVQNTVLDYLGDDGQTTHTAQEIASAWGLNWKSVQKAAKKLNVKLKRGKWGGLRHPCNGHAKARMLLTNDAKSV